MKQKLITVVLTLIMILASSLIMLGDNYNILKLCTLLIGGLLLIIFLLMDYKNLKFDKKDIFLLIFLFFIFVSTFLSSNIFKSLIGESNRYEGLLMFLVYACIYFCAKKYFAYEKMEELFHILFYVCLAIGILGIFQNYLTDFTLLPLFGKGICATFGNSNFFGSFISIVLPIVMAIFIQKGSKKGLILSLIMFFNMLSSGTRSAWVAFVIISFIGIIYIIKAKSKVYSKRFGVLLLCFISILVFLLISPNSELGNRFKLIKGEISNTVHSGLEDTMGSGRIEIWKMTLKLIAQKPLLGCGTDNLASGLAINCTGDLYTFVFRTHTFPDKAHNEYLQIAATIGIPALIVYCILIGMILFGKARHLLSDNISFIFSITIISYLVQAFFNISTIGVAPLFWMILGLADNQDFIKNLKNIF